MLSIQELCAQAEARMTQLTSANTTMQQEKTVLQSVVDEQASDISAARQTLEKIIGIT